MNFSKIKEITIPEGSVKQISIGMQVLWRKQEPAPSIDCLTFTANTAGSTVKMAAVGSPTNTPDLEYSTDGSHWNTYTIGDTITLSNINDYVQFRGDNDGFYETNSNYHRFKMTGRIAASGSVMSLLDKTEDMVTMTAANDHCFYKIFYDCYSLTTAPKLPATTLASNCYKSMFSDCNSLTSAPQLPATTLQQNCYNAMFFGCYNLTTAPALPATTMASNCYNQMFYGCTALTTAPALPATTLADNCYNQMFEGCTELTTAPALPATTLANSCYYHMFTDCTSLTSSPVLPATTLASRCYEEMFMGCSSLNFIEAYFTTTPGTSYTGNWVDGVAASGTFVKSLSATWTTTGVNGIPTSWVAQPKGCLKFTANTAGSTIKMVKTHTTAPNVSVKYSRDGNTWSNYNTNTAITLQNVGSYVYFKGDNTTFSEYDIEYGNYVSTKFSMTGSISASGNIMTMLDSTGSKKTLTSENNYCFTFMFLDCAALTSAPELPATTLAVRCYQHMFRGCSGLTSAPVLPSTTLANYCYYHMFNGCTSLTSAPELPATTMTSGCYSLMFHNCTALTTAPALPATTLAKYCYSEMFDRCVSLTSAPALPARTMQEDCYQLMFRGCTSLTSAPALPATTLQPYCYDQMFSGCSSLTSAPALPATSLAEYCYRQMFQDCTSFTSAPALPAKTLQPYCYSGMFRGCTGIEESPILRAKTLKNYCYSGMFKGCTNLNLVSAYFTTTPSTNYTDSWLEGVAATGTFVKGREATWTNVGTYAVPTGWTVQYEG